MRYFSSVLKINKKYLILYITILILFFEWFYNHPALRYGGYNLISIIFFLPISIYLSAKKINNKNLKLLITTFVVLSFVIFSGRNVNRIYKENILYKYNPFKQPFYKVDAAYFNEYKNLKKRAFLLKWKMSILGFQNVKMMIFARLALFQFL